MHIRASYEDDALRVIKRGRVGCEGGGMRGDMDLFGIRGKMAVDQFIRFRHRIKIAAQLPLFAEFSFFSKLSLGKTVLGVLKKGNSRRFCV